MRHDRPAASKILVVLALLGVLFSPVAPVASTPAAADSPPSFQRGPDPTDALLDARWGPLDYAQIAVSDAQTPGFGSGTISYPTDTSHGRFGAIAVSPGFVSAESQIAWYGPFLASHGFVVITFNTLSIYDQPPARATQLLAALDYLVSAASPVRDRIDASRLAVMGHSMGGGGTIEATSRRTSLRASIPLTPWHTVKSWPDVVTPTLNIGAQNDTVATTAEHSRPLHEGLSADIDKMYLEMRDEGHGVPNAYNVTIGRFSVAWLKRFVDDDTRYDTFLCPAPSVGATFNIVRATCPFGVPDPPGDLVGTAGNASVALSWLPPRIPGSAPVTGYVVEQTTDASGSSGWVPAQGTCAAALTEARTERSCTAGDLANDTAYRFRVRASNVWGPSNPSALSAVMVPVGVPSAPTGTSAELDGSRVTITWTAPETGDTAPITGYRVEQTTEATGTSGWAGAFGGCAPPQTEARTATTCVIDGLSSGFGYRFRVLGINATGIGLASESSARVVLATLPGQPRTVRSANGASGMTVTWTAPSSDGGLDITRYTVTSNLEGRQCTWTEGPLACTFSGLTRGQSYRFAVTATNALGTGATSTQSAALAYVEPASEPRSVTVTPGDGTLQVNWQSPADNGGGAIASYRVTASPAEATCTATAPSLSCTIGGLANLKTQQISVVAINSAGPGTPTALSAPVMPSAPPSVSVAFTDVPSGVFFDTPARWLFANGITTSNPYRPSDVVARDQMAAFMWRMAGQPDIPPSCGFSDEDRITTWARQGACWLAVAGITNANPYAPTGAVTREQMAAFLWRMAGQPAATSSCGFRDQAQIAEWARPGACWLLANRITTTNPYDPKSPVTRGQMAAFLYRFATR
jgi:dienelactone hydrolase